jgi:hypothetical protein
MIVQTYSPKGRNTGQLEPEVGTIITNLHDGRKQAERAGFDYIEIKKGRFVHHDISHILKTDRDVFYRRIYGLEYGKRTIYWLDFFGTQSKNSGVHIALNWWQNQKFRWLQGVHWFQQEENIRYLVNILFLIIGLLIALK